MGIPLDICVDAFYDALQVSVADVRKSRHLSEIHLIGNDTNSVSAVIAIIRSLLDMGDESGHLTALERFKSRDKEFNIHAKDLQLTKPSTKINSSQQKGKTTPGMKNVRDKTNSSDDEILTSSTTQLKVSSKDNVQSHPSLDPTRDDITRFFETGDSATGIQMEDAGETIENDFNEAETTATTTFSESNYFGKNYGGPEQLTDITRDSVPSDGYGACAKDTKRFDSEYVRYTKLGKERLYPPLDE